MNVSSIRTIPPRLWRGALFAALLLGGGCSNVIVDHETDRCDDIEGAALCDGECVLLTADPRNCGACGALCASGQSCVDGVCQGCPTGADCSMDCPDGLVGCGDACVDVTTDPENCGACGALCGVAQTCGGGACQCPSGMLMCGSVCSNLVDDPSNCGSCANACAPGETCSGGACQCPAGNTQCPDACADLFSDPANCGACGALCAPGEVCAAGACQCVAGETECPAGCADLSSDPANCGACGLACPAGDVCSLGTCVCPAGEVDCGGTCTDVTNDPQNCGTCGNACVEGQTCMSGVCACPPGTTLCGGACTDIASSPDNCGACGNACPAGQTCEGGLCLTAVSSWPTLAGNMRRSGENTVELAGPPNADGWAVGLAPEQLNPVMIAGGRAYTTFGGFNGGGNGKLVALSIADGSTLWTHDFGEIYDVGQVTLDGGRLYVQNAKGIDPGTGAAISAFDPATGGIIWSSPIGAQWESYWSPAVVAGRVVMNGGTYGGLYGFDANNGNELFFNDTLEQYDEWSPAVHNGVVYTFIEGKLRAHDPATGLVQWTTNPGWDWAGWSMITSPVFSDTHAFVIAPPSIHAINVATHAIAWTINAGCKGQPAVAGGVVYSICGGKLSARDATNGDALWAFDGDSALAYPPTIAAGYVYVSSKNNVYAVNIASHAEAWTAPVGGWLSIAAGRLFVARSNGTLTTYVLANGP